MVSSPSLRSSSRSVGEGEREEFMATHGNGSGDEGAGLVYRQTGSWRDHNYHREVGQIHAT